MERPKQNNLNIHYLTNNQALIDTDKLNELILYSRWAEKVLMNSVQIDPECAGYHCRCGEKITAGEVFYQKCGNCGGHVDGLPKLRINNEENGN